MGSFKQSDMLYDDGRYYKWSAKENQDNPTIRSGTDSIQLNRTEGYEVLHFINSLGDKYFNGTPSIKTCQKIETMIRDHVPSDLKTHEEIQYWIITNWERY